LVKICIIILNRSTNSDLIMHNHELFEHNKCHFLKDDDNDDSANEWRWNNKNEDDWKEDWNCKKKKMNLNQNWYNPFVVTFYANNYSMIIYYMILILL